MAGSSMASDCECSRLEEKEVRRPGVKEGVKERKREGSTPTPAISYRFQNKVVTEFDCWK
jgi:hypothetical protein